MKLYLKLLLLFFVFVMLMCLKYVFYNDKDNIRICSWNVRFFGLKDPELLESQSYYQFISNYIQQLQPDILCLQEVCSYTSIRHLQSLLKNYKLYVSNDILHENTNTVNKIGFQELTNQIGNHETNIGNLQFNVFLVKSHVKVVGLTTIHPKLICLDYIDNKTMKKISIYNCHFPSNFSGDKSKMRRNVMKTLKTDIKKRKLTDVIIAGDLNTEKNDGELEPLEDDYIDLFNTTMAKNRDIGMNPMYTHIWDRNHLKRSHIDYFFISPTLLHRVKDVFIDTTFCGINMGTLLSKISDHCVIIMDMTNI